MRKERNSRKGFTIVELLTVMGVIAILIGLLVPALNLVRDFADEIQQKAQFHGIEVAIEMFNTEYGFYPPSTDNAITGEETDVSGTTSSTINYGGAHKLAEALIGWDQLGFHPRAEFRSDGLFKHDNGSGTVVLGEAYEPVNGYAGGGNPLFVETAAENIQARTPFMELEKANGYKMSDVYGIDGLISSATSNFDPASVVLCDEYGKKRSGGKKTGMPVLYWRANTTGMDQDNEATAVGAVRDDIYEYADNEEILLSAPAGTDATAQAMLVGIDFDKAILNPDVPAGLLRPYRASSYILISAGKDGYYGTADDITNFDKND